MRILLGAFSLASRAACRLRAALYAAGLRRPERATIPVLCVGNLALGGSEKTPLVIEILARLEALGLRPALVSRGYRGRWERTGGILSDGSRLLGDWREGGDEPALVARRRPRAGVFVGRDRAASCRAAAAAGFDVAVLDDGFQHLRLARDLDIVLHRPGGAAPLREGLSALRRADILLLPAASSASGPHPKTGPAEKLASAAGRRYPALRIFFYGVSPAGFYDLPAGPFAPPDGLLTAAEALAGRPALAFCAIARPDRFFAALERAGVRPIARLVFPDHDPYRPADLAAIADAAGRTRAEILVTTEKDAVKIAGRLAALGLPVRVLRITLDLPEGFFEAVRSALPGPPERA